MKLAAWNRPGQQPLDEIPLPAILRSEPRLIKFNERSM
jgi:hypothetical protein